MNKTFPGGIHPLSFKEETSNAPIRKATLPKQLVIPLCQHLGSACECRISSGSEIKTGEFLGKSEKFPSSSIHSSVTGKVIKIENRPHPLFGSSASAVIDSYNEEAFAFSGQRHNLEDLEPTEIINLVKEAGIVGLGGACFPTHIKLSPPKEKLIDTFILNGAECEPYLSCDNRLMLERPQDIIKGASLIMKALGIKRGIIAIEDNKRDAIKAMRSTLNEVQSTKYDVRIISLTTKYPQGGEKQLIKALLNKEVPPGGLPMDVGCVVDNVATALSVYEAVRYNKPLYERVITVCGDAIKAPANLLVKIGTPVSDLIKDCGGLTKDIGKIIFGGPMMGFCQCTTDVPVIKGTSGILFLSKKHSDIQEPASCIRCGRCIDACPVNLLPTTIALAAEKGRLDIASEFNITDCIECGVCSYVCPSKIPLVHLIKQAKRNLACEIVK